ncbi:hypothetical protein GWI33_011165, partial [Rhynchophorus ferrugineus]
QLDLVARTTTGGTQNGVEKNWAKRADEMRKNAAKGQKGSMGYCKRGPGLAKIKEGSINEVEE